MIIIRRSSLARSVLVAFAILLACAFLNPGPARAAGVYTGRVFQDFNGDGLQDLSTTFPTQGAPAAPNPPNATTDRYAVAVDRGVINVRVTLFDSAGNSVTTLTDTNGDYTLDSSTLAPGPYRLEFTEFENAGFASGARSLNNGTSVQIVPDGGGVFNFTVNRGFEYCQNDPLLVVPCYVFDGATANAAADVVVSVPYSSGTVRQGVGQNNGADVATPTTHDINVDANVVGSVFGLAYDRVRNELYASTLYKRHTAFGPGGIGAVYRILPDGNPATSDPTTVYFDLATLPGNPAGTNFRLDPNWAVTTEVGDTDPDAPVVSPYLRDSINASDNVGWDSVGKIGLGGIAIDRNAQFIYVMALGNRTLYRIPVVASPGVPSAASIISQQVPLSLPGCPSTNDARPFAVTYTEWLGVPHLYVGIMCTGESTAPAAPVAPTACQISAPAGANYCGDPSVLRAYVYEVNPTTLAFSGAPVFQMQMNYPRGISNNTALSDADWQIWSPIWRSTIAGNNASRKNYPQPMLTQMAFERGNLILAFRDRFGDQGGDQVRDVPDDAALRRLTTAGDIIKACGNPVSGWTLENAGSCGGSGPGLPGTNPRPQGPGNAEFYAGDEYEPYFDGGSANPPGTSSIDAAGNGRHDEAGLGGVFQIPGFNDSIFTMFDPEYLDGGTGVNAGGFRWLNDTSGLVSRSYRLYDGASAGTFGKANGLGDVVALCAPAPVEVGNFIWNDLDADGVQDPNETPLAGVTVNLYDSTGALVATAITDASGYYIFSNATGVSTPSSRFGLTFDLLTAYSIRLDNAADFVGAGPLAALALTRTDNAGAGAGDGRDNDASLILGFPRINFTLGGIGDNNHTYDFGFTDPALLVVAPGAGGGGPAATPVPVTSSGGISLNKSVSPNRAQPGGTLTWTIIVSNMSGSALMAGTVTDALPAGLTFLSSTVTAGSPAQVVGNQITWNVGVLQAGQVATLTILARVDTFPAPRAPGLCDAGGPGLISNSACIDANCATAAVSCVPAALPSTGGENIWKIWASIGGGAAALALLAYAGWRFSRRRRAWR